MQTSFPIRSKVCMFLLTIMLLEALITEVDTISSKGFVNTRPARAGNGVSFSPKRHAKYRLDKQRAPTSMTTEVPKTRNRDRVLPRPFIQSLRRFELEKLFGKPVYIDLRREANNDRVLPAVEVAKPSYPRRMNFIDLEDERTTTTPPRVTGGYTYIDLQSEKLSVSVSTDKSGNKAYIDLDSESTTTESNREMVYIDIEKGIESTTTKTNEANVYIDLQAEQRNPTTTLPPPSVTTTMSGIFYIDLQPDTDNRDPNLENIMTTPGNNQSRMRVGRARLGGNRVYINIAGDEYDDLTGRSNTFSMQNDTLENATENGGTRNEDTTTKTVLSTTKKLTKNSSSLDISTTVGIHGGNRVYINIAGDEYDDLGGRSDTFSMQNDTSENGGTMSEDTATTTVLSTTTNLTTNSSSLDTSSTSTSLPETTTVAPRDNFTAVIPSPIDTTTAIPFVNETTTAIPSPNEITTAISPPNETTTAISPPNETTTGIPSPNETTTRIPSPNETTTAIPSPTTPEQSNSTKKSEEPTTTEENLPVVAFMDDPKFAGSPTMHFMDDYEVYRKRGCVGFSCNEF